LRIISAVADVLHRLRCHGNTLVVIETQPGCDQKPANWWWILGPEGGSKGGYIIATG